MSKKAGASLVKYDTAILVSTSGNKKGKKKAIIEKKAAEMSYEDLLNSILPPKEKYENGQLWIQ